MNDELMPEETVTALTTPEERLCATMVATLQEFFQREGLSGQKLAGRLTRLEEEVAAAPSMSDLEDFVTDEDLENKVSAAIQDLDADDILSDIDYVGSEYVEEEIRSSVPDIVREVLDEEKVPTPEAFQELSAAHDALQARVYHLEQMFDNVMKAVAAAFFPQDPG